MKAELIDQMGSDLTVVNAARVSFDKESEWDWYDNKGNFKEMGVISEKDSKLISYLAKHNHFTPFTHCVITLRETVPIFVARQRFKHTVGFSYNEVSRRYVDDEPKFFYPTFWRERPNKSIKQGSGEKHKGSVAFELDYHHLIEDAKELYEDMIREGVAPEQARMVLPQSMYTSYYVTGSLSAFARAYKLRSESHAQKEIQDLAKQWDALLRPLYPVSWKALVDG